MRVLEVDLSVVIVAKGASANRKDSCFDDLAKRVLREIAKLGKAGNADRIDIVAECRFVRSVEHQRPYTK